ncbi:MAG TPA: hypothetical protein VGK33_01915 [Chloroflexota bacterium]
MTAFFHSSPVAKTAGEVARRAQRDVTEGAQGGYNWLCRASLQPHS